MGSGVLTVHLPFSLFGFGTACLLSPAIFLASGDNTLTCPPDGKIFVGPSGDDALVVPSGNGTHTGWVLLECKFLLGMLLLIDSCLASSCTLFHTAIVACWASTSGSVPS